MHVSTFELDSLGYVKDSDNVPLIDEESTRLRDWKPACSLISQQSAAVALGGLWIQRNDIDVNEDEQTIKWDIKRQHAISLWTAIM